MSSLQLLLTAVPAYGGMSADHSCTMPNFSVLFTVVMSDRRVFM